MADPVALPGGLREVVFRLGAAMLIGAAVGVNRELRDKPAGMRTHALVALGASLVTLTIVELSMREGRPSPDAVSRAVQGIITGIGFLGGGVIIRQQDGTTVQGLTTAASIWLVACLGVACGAGQWRTAVVAMVLTLFVLVIGGSVEGLLRRFTKRPAEQSGRGGEG